MTTCSTATTLREPSLAVAFSAPILPRSFASPRRLAVPNRTNRGARLPRAQTQPPKRPHASSASSPARRARPPNRFNGPASRGQQRRQSIARPPSGAPPRVLLDFLRAASSAGTSTDVAWAVRELATHYVPDAGHGGSRPPVSGKNPSSSSSSAAAAAAAAAPIALPSTADAAPERVRSEPDDAATLTPASDATAAVSSAHAKSRGFAPLPFELWRAALHACLTRCRDLQAGMVVLHAGEPLVPPGDRRRDAYVPVVLALASAHRWDALVALYQRLWAAAFVDDGRRSEPLPRAAPDERLVVYGANLAVDAGRIAVAAKLVHTMQHSGRIMPTAYSYAVLLKGYGRSSNIHGVDRTLEQMSLHGVAFDQVSFNSAVDAYVRCGDLNAARSLVDDPAVSHLRDTRTFNIILKGFARRCLIVEAFQVRDEIVAAGLVPNEVTVNTLVDACVRVGDFTSALKLADEVAAGPGSVRTGNPDQRNQLTIALSRILAGLADAGNLDDAVRLLDEMERRGAPPNHITYCALINACLRHNDVPRARMLFRSQEERTGVPPTLEVYNAMVAGLCKAGDEFNVDAAVRLLRQMRSGHHLREQHAQATGDGAEDESDDAKLAEDPQRLGEADGPSASGGEHMGESAVCDSFVAPNVGESRDITDDESGPCDDGQRLVDAAFSSRSAGREGTVEDVASVEPNRRWEVEKEARSDRTPGRVTPSDVTYNAVIDGLVRFSRVHDAEDVLEWMCEDGVTPSVITYTTLIKGWGVERDLAEARRVFRRMAKDGIAPDKLALNAFINACVRSDNATAAEQVLDMMESNDRSDTDISPDVWSYTPLIALHTRRGSLDDVWNVYCRARSHGMAVNRYVADLMVNAVVALGASRVRQGRSSEREKIADMSIGIVCDAWEDLRDRHLERLWRRRLVAIFEHDAALRARVSRRPGSGTLRRHGDMGSRGRDGLSGALSCDEEWGLS